jgi:hypothetical protein
MSKRQRQNDRHWTERLPDAVFNMVVAFADHTLVGVLKLQLVSKHFLRVMSMPIMVSHLTVNLRRPVDLLKLDAQVAGLRKARFSSAGSLRMIKIAPALRELDLSFCKTLTNESLKALTSLRRLDTLVLKGCSKLSDLRYLSQVPSLKTLSISSCISVFALPDCDLVSLEMNGCMGVRHWDPLRNMDNLHTLSMSGCRVIDDTLEFLPSNLRNLNVAFCRDLTDFALFHIARSRMLSVLNLTGCTKITTLEPLQKLDFMQDIRLVFCYTLQNVDALKNMSRLRVVHAPHADLSCEALRRGMVGLDMLDELDLSNSRTTHVGFDTPLPSLRKLEMRSCPLLYDLGAIRQVKALHSLDLSGCSMLGDQNLESLQHLFCLRELFLNGCVNTTNQGLQAVGQITTLRRLSLFGCSLVTDLSLLADLKELHHLDLQGCTQVGDDSVHALSKLCKMRSLNLSRCNLTDAGLFAVKSMPDLHSLNLDACKKLTDVGLHALSSLSRLQQLDLSRCKGLQTLKPLRALTELRFINLSGCVRLTDASLANLIQCARLKTVYANHCKQITKEGLALVLRSKFTPP